VFTLTQTGRTQLLEHYEQYPPLQLYIMAATIKPATLTQIVNKVKSTNVDDPNNPWPYLPFIDRKYVVKHLRRLIVRALIETDNTEALPLCVEATEYKNFTRPAIVVGEGTNNTNAQHVHNINPVTPNDDLTSQLIKTADNLGVPTNHVVSIVCEDHKWNNAYRHHDTTRTTTRRLRIGDNLWWCRTCMTWFEVK
jgi:hypothetical protein